MKIERRGYDYSFRNEAGEYQDLTGCALDRDVAPNVLTFVSWGGNGHQLEIEILEETDTEIRFQAKGGASWKGAPDFYKAPLVLLDRRQEAKHTKT